MSQIASLSLDSSDFISLKLKAKTTNRSLSSSPYLTRSRCDTCATITSHKLAHCTFECCSCHQTTIIENQPDTELAVNIKDEMNFFAKEEVTEAQIDSPRSSMTRLSKERALSRVWGPTLKRGLERSARAIWASGEDAAPSLTSVENEEPSMKRSRTADVEVFVSGINHFCSLCPLKTSNRSDFAKHLMTRRHTLNVRKYKKSLNSQPIMA